MPETKLEFGKQAEKTALEFLKAKGYKILRRNYRSKFSEVDIIAEDKGTICFVEVKARHSDVFGKPSEAISRHKQRQISKSAICYLKENNALERSARFDILTFLYTKNPPEIDLIRNAFELNSNFTV